MEMFDVNWLRLIADYDPESGKITWRNRGPETFRCDRRERTRVSSRWNKLRAGKCAGHINKAGYVMICLEHKNVFAHKMAWAMHYGFWPNDQIDHINGVKSDNRIQNLRTVTAQENSKNRKKPENNTSGKIGVHFHKPSKKWHARVMDNGKRLHIGAFLSPEEASEAYTEISSKLGFHENHGR